MMPELTAEERRRRRLYEALMPTAYDPGSSVSPMTLNERQRQIEALKLLAPADAAKRTPGAQGSPDPVMQAFRLLAEIAPGTGEAMSAMDFNEARKSGDKLGMVLGAAGTIPVGGSLLRGGKKVVKAGAEGLDALRAALKLADEADTGTRLAYTMEDLRKVPDVAQVPITIRPIPARGLPDDVKKAVKKNRGEFEDAVKRGMDKGGLEWYNLEPIRLGFVQELGEEAGNKEFARFTQHLAATSPRATVAQNIRRASAFSLLNRHGIPVPEDQSLLSEIGPTLGHLAHRTAHVPAARDIERFGTLASSDEVLLNRPKTASFGENLRGNYEPVTIDAHNLAAWGLPGSRANAAYDVLEKEQKDIAAKLGIRPAQVQSSAWIGAADETGVADARPFVNVFDDVVLKAAKRQGISPDLAFQRFLRGTGALGVAGMMGAGAMRGRDDGA